MLVNCDIKHEGSTITNHIISYTRNQSMCDGIGNGQFIVPYDTPHSFTLYDVILIYEDGRKMGTFYVISNTVSVDGATRLIEFQDGSKKLQDYFITTLYEIQPGVDTTMSLITKYANEANVDVVFDTIYGNHFMNERTMINPASAIDIIVPLMQQSGWYFFFDVNDLCHISKVYNNSANIVDTITDTEILNYSENKNDAMFRNRAVVWGISSRGGDNGRVFAEYSKITPWNYSNTDFRTIVIDGSSVLNQATADNIAYQLVEEFADIEILKTIALHGFKNIKISNSVALSSTYRTSASCMVMEVHVEVTTGGAITTLVLDKRCPRVFAYEIMEDDINYIYAGTRGQGVHRLHTSGSAWEDFGQGIEYSDIEHLAAYNGKLACVSTTGSAFSRRTSEAAWRQQVVPQHITEENVYVNNSKYASCAINQTNGNFIYANTTASGDDNHNTRSWLYELSSERELVRKSQVVVNEDIYDIAVTDIDVDYDGKKFIAASIPADEFEIPLYTLGVLDVNRTNSVAPNISDLLDFQLMFSKRQVGREDQYVYYLPDITLPVNDSHILGDRYMFNWYANNGSGTTGSIYVAEKMGTDSYLQHAYSVTGLASNYKHLGMIFFDGFHDGHLYVTLMFPEVFSSGVYLYHKVHTKKYELDLPTDPPSSYYTATLISSVTTTIFSLEEVESFGIPTSRWNTAFYHSISWLKIEDKIMAIMVYDSADPLEQQYVYTERTFYVELTKDSVFNKTQIDTVYHYQHVGVNGDNHRWTYCEGMSTTDEGLCYVKLYSGNSLTVEQREDPDLPALGDISLISGRGSQKFILNAAAFYCTGGDEALVTSQVVLDSDDSHNFAFINDSYVMPIGYSIDHKNIFKTRFAWNWMDNGEPYGDFGRRHNDFVVSVFTFDNAAPVFVDGFVYSELMEYDFTPVSNNWSDSYEANIREEYLYDIQATAPRGISNKFGQAYYFGIDQRDNKRRIFDVMNPFMTYLGEIPDLPAIPEYDTLFITATCMSIIRDNKFQTLAFLGGYILDPESPGRRLKTTHMLFLPFDGSTFGDWYYVENHDLTIVGHASNVYTNLGYHCGLFTFGSAATLYIFAITGNFAWEGLENVHTIFSLPEVSASTSALVDISLFNKFNLESSKKFPLSSITTEHKHTLCEDTALSSYEIYPPTFPDLAGHLHDLQTVYRYRKMMLTKQYTDSRVFDIGVDSSITEMVTGTDVLGRFVAASTGSSLGGGSSITLFRTTEVGQVPTDVMVKALFTSSSGVGVDDYFFDLPEYSLTPVYSGSSVINGSIWGMDFNNSSSPILCFTSSGSSYSGSGMSIPTSFYRTSGSSPLAFEDISINFPQTEITELRIDDAL